MGLLRKQGEPVEMIDLRAPAAEPAGEGTDAPPALAWGAPAPCPQCGGKGYLDGIDPGRAIMYQHCTECWHKYEITEEQVASEA